MDPARWQRVDALLHDALALDEGARDAFLREACGGDEQLRQDVASLLVHQQAAQDFMETPAIAIAGTLGAALPGGERATPARIGHYTIHGRLGEGGMGVVYLAEDERLGRRVALKLLRHESADAAARTRLVREARLAASVSHPLICQVFELGEWEGQPFIAMELVAGEPLSAKLTGAPLTPREALDIALPITDALAELHRHGVMHRDLKPSNIFITPGSIKLLDFGVARPVGAVAATSASVTAIGMFVGTPQYAAPEQLSGGEVDGRADLFALGVILFEMLAGRPPFAGSTLPALMHAVLYDTPPPLTGSPAIAALDRVLHRTLAKNPDDRYATAEALGADLRRVAPLLGDDPAVTARPLARLAVLPFRLLKPDPEIDYLTTSLADALISSLLGYESLVVRSSLKSARYVSAAPDLHALAADLAVDMVLTGSIIRVRDDVRVNAELVTVPAGDVCWTHRTQIALDAVFDVYDDLARRVAESLPLTPRDRARLPAGGSANAKAFDLYLHGMKLRMETSGWAQARACFDQALQLDPGFAAAWAERGRLDRVLGKYGDRSRFADAEVAFRRALELDPDHGAAECYYAQLEIDLGRLEAALERLLGRARQGRAEPHVYAALVHACRYGGLLEHSVEAHRAARRFDPAVPTSVLHTYYMQGDYARALAEAHHGSDPLEARVLAAMGRDDEALEAARREEGRFASVPMLSAFSTALRAALEGRADLARGALQPFDAEGFTDGEGLFYVAEIYARVGDIDRAHAMLMRAADAGFVCLPAYERDPFLAGLRGSGRWRDLIERISARQQAIAARFARSNVPALSTAITSLSSSPASRSRETR